MSAIIQGVHDGTRLPINRQGIAKPSAKTIPSQFTQAKLRAKIRNLEAQARAGTIQGTGAGPAYKSRKDPLWRGKILVDSHACWSLNKSKEHYGVLPAMLVDTKLLVKQEAIAWLELERDPDRMICG